MSVESLCVLYNKVTAVSNCLSDSVAKLRQFERGKHDTGGDNVAYPSPIHNAFGKRLELIRKVPHSAVLLLLLLLHQVLLSFSVQLTLL